ncbi:2'-5' RNA ligase family protein [Streptomyces sp. C184]|uniref:2'-5' RNA ligase family protein n=1 Tax=Streptomyces sp. C184 TaxID=3237121 RepID=UPI0034C6A7B8
MVVVVAGPVVLLLSLALVEVPCYTGAVTDDGTRELQAGRTGLIVQIPEAEPAVRAWRERLDPGAREGVPAHVTVLFPFLREDCVDGAVHRALEEILAAHPAFPVRFESCGRFPGVLYLAPEPDGPFRQLTRAIADRWPQTPPFGGRFTDVVPHLTVAQGHEDAVLERVEAELLGGTPITALVSSVELLVHDGTRWHERASFALG